MAGFGGNTNDDLLTAAVLDILAQNADGVRTFSANTDKKSVSGYANMLKKD